MENIQYVDTYLFRIIHDGWKNPLLDILLPYARLKYTWIPLYIYLVFHIFRRNSKSYRRILFAAAMATILGDAICSRILKELIERIRPCQMYINEIWYHSFGLCSDTYSCPSCHALNHAMLASVISPFVSRKMNIFLIFWVLLIGFSQVYVGVHYPFDVFIGAVLGLMLGKWIARFI